MLITYVGYFCLEKRQIDARVQFFFLESIDLDIIPDNEKEMRTAGNDLALYDVLLAEYSALPTRKKTN